MASLSYPNDELSDGSARRGMMKRSVLCRAPPSKLLDGNSQSVGTRGRPRWLSEVTQRGDGPDASQRPDTLR
jgi:hypothetical protein